MNHAFRNGISLVRFQGYRPVLQINQKLSLQDEEELVFIIVLVPVKFALHDAQAHHAVIHLAKGLIVPFFFAGGNEAWNVDQLEKAELRFQVDVVGVLFAHAFVAMRFGIELGKASAKKEKTMIPTDEGGQRIKDQ